MACAVLSFPLSSRVNGFTSNAFHETKTLTSSDCQIGSQLCRLEYMQRYQYVDIKTIFSSHFSFLKGVPIRIDRYLLDIYITKSSAIVSIHASVVRVEETDVVLLTYGEDHGVLVVHQLDDGHLHVRGGVPGQVEVLPGGVAGVVVADRVDVLAHPGREHAAAGSNVIKATSIFTTLYCINNIFMHTIHFSIDFHSFSSCFGLHGLAHLDVVAHLAEPGALGHAAPVPPGAGGAGGPSKLPSHLYVSSDRKGMC